MIKRLLSRRNCLPVMIVVALVGLVILTALAIGIPAILSMQRQYVWQARQALVQADRTVEALMIEQRGNLKSLASLTAQRPTLQRLILDGDQQKLQDYLANLQTTAGLDLILLCGADQRPIAQVGSSISASACDSNSGTGLFIERSGQQPIGFMLASESIPNLTEQLAVVVGRRLDDRYAQELRDWTGLGIALYDQQQLLANSFAIDEGFNANTEDSLRELSEQVANIPEDAHYSLLGNPYYLLERPNSASGLEMIFFYPASEVVNAQRNLTRYAAIGMLLVVVFSSIIGYLGARQISRPLGRLRDAASRLRKGDLATPITVNTRIGNISQVANSLEAARSTLQHSQKQLQQEKEWMDYLLEAVVEGILTIDRRGRITFFSQGAERITGWSAAQVLGRALDDIFQVVDEDTPFSQRLPDPGGRQKIVARLAGGRQAILAVSAAGVAPPGAGKASTVLVLRDVSDEETIRRLLGEFLANIAHEFRTPLSALAASIELLMDQLPGLDPQELSELLNSVHLGVLSLQTLIDNLLEGASIETGRFRVYPKSVDPHAILVEAVHTMEPLAVKYGQTIELASLADLPAVLADARRTEQVLVNLLSNAIKWSPSGGRIRLIAAQEGERILVTVSDQGPGIPDGRQSEVFLRFDRTQTRDGRGESGAGLGLSVVKAIVEAQGGQVGAYNDPQGGAVFWFSLVVDGNREAERKPAA